MDRSALKTSPQAISLSRIPVGTARILRIFLWLLFPLLIWWVVKDIPLAAIVDVLKQVRFERLPILIGLNAVIFILFSSRWWLILSAFGYRRPFFSLAGYRLAAFGVTYFTPGPQFGGEPLQVYLLKRREALPTEIAVASVAVDKLLELLANFSFLLVGVIVILYSNVLTDSAAPALLFLPASLLVFPIGYLVALWFDRLPASWMVRKLTVWLRDSSRFKSAHQTINATEHQVARFCRQNPFILLVATSLSVLIWVLMVIEFRLMLQFLGASLNLFQVLIALTAARIAFLLPLPAGLGSLEAGQVMAMSLFGLNPGLGLSLSLIIRARDFLFGGIGLGLGGLLNR